MHRECVRACHIHTRVTRKRFTGLHIVIMRKYARVVYYPSKINSLEIYNIMTLCE